MLGIMHTGSQQGDGACRLRALTFQLLSSFIPCHGLFDRLINGFSLSHSANFCSATRRSTWLSASPTATLPSPSEINKEAYQNFKDPNNICHSPNRRSFQLAFFQKRRESTGRILGIQCSNPSPSIQILQKLLLSSQNGQDPSPPSVPTSY